MTGSSSLFSSGIEDHLALKRQNSHLGDDMPIDEFAVHDPFQNHPLFKTEAEARAEEEETGEHPAVSLEMPADTVTMRVMEEPEDGQPIAWIETTTDQEFRCEQPDGVSRHELEGRYAGRTADHARLARG